MPTLQISNFKNKIVHTFIKLFILLAIYSLLTINYSLAQSPVPLTALDKAQNDYTFQFTKYREAQNKYINARSSYLTFQTATAKNNAYLATSDYLLKIDDLYHAYLFLVNENGNSLGWQNSDISKDHINQIIDEEIAFFDNHRKKVKDAKTLEQLPDLATDLRSHRDKEFNLKINKILATFEVIEAQSAIADFNKLARDLDKIITSKIEKDQNQSILANWISEITNIKAKTQNYLTKAKELLEKTKEQTASGDELKDISSFAQLAKNELLRSKPLFKEVIGIL
ncbi:hypothetical protein A2W45_00190 [Candidatus Curtissbacteria bacterium RIFCSPHIGHO2_12_41_11]|uniref:Uncharacterized protein n=3 Tax=Candidatus Curtissiibacteriota TaxID=1752717 RepID=A0A1F5HT25_9BACT|nr:MAG: hypothetical protein UU56_C0021G0021 [Candidatus Curtissbacteria bacterium GW2011_GWA2_41_24]OGE00611.1 MAG: hypothetical protein A2W45_00190 [Candidatus Curtissbacteria bacterium RIFCSPHIGHO2_12_41_11]OGE07210.1 MAG: hypothetical protein A2W70_02110 [Candidatus Curtissbacteria bacterium RIFCSPLOWO2_02_41_11]